jgi:hypothetical protein
MGAIRLNATQTAKRQMKIVNIVIERLSENSTWRGVILVVTALGLRLEPELQNQIVAAGLSLVGIINIIRKGK